jgi:transcriptional regulator with XRE-family HTH domain
MVIDDILSKKGWTQADLARALNVSDGHIADLKSERRYPSLKLAKRMAEVAEMPEIVDAVVRQKLQRIA